MVKGVHLSVIHREAQILRDPLGGALLSQGTHSVWVVAFRLIVQGLFKLLVYGRLSPLLPSALWLDINFYLCPF